MCICWALQTFQHHHHHHEHGSLPSSLALVADVCKHMTIKKKKEIFLKKSDEIYEIDRVLRKNTVLFKNELRLHIVNTYCTKIEEYKWLCFHKRNAVRLFFFCQQQKDKGLQYKSALHTCDNEHITEWLFAITFRYSKSLNKTYEYTSKN